VHKVYLNANAFVLQGADKQTLLCCQTCFGPMRCQRTSIHPCCQRTLLSNNAFLSKSKLTQSACLAPQVAVPAKAEAVANSDVAEAKDAQHDALGSARAPSSPSRSGKEPPEHEQPSQVDGKERSKREHSSSSSGSEADEGTRAASDVLSPSLHQTSSYSAMDAEAALSSLRLVTGRGADSDNFGCVFLVFLLFLRLFIS
jgi:hypothetical protein